MKCCKYEDDWGCCTFVTDLIPQEHPAWVENAAGLRVLCPFLDDEAQSDCPSNEPKEEENDRKI